MAIQLLKSGTKIKADWLGKPALPYFKSTGLEFQYHQCVVNEVYPVFSSNGVNFIKKGIIVASVPIPEGLQQSTSAMPSDKVYKLDGDWAPMSKILKKELEVAMVGLIPVTDIPKFKLDASGVAISMEEVQTIVVGGSSKIVSPKGIIASFKSDSSNPKQKKEVGVVIEKNIDFAKSLPQVPLMEAEQLYQKVKSTGNTSVYFYLASFKNDLRVAVRRNQNVSIRVEGSGIAMPAYSAAMTAFGLKKGDNGKYYSAHFNVAGDLSLTCKTIGAFVGMLGFENLIECGDVKNIEATK